MANGAESRKPLPVSPFQQSAVKKANAVPMLHLRSGAPSKTLLSFMPFAFHSSSLGEAATTDARRINTR